MTVVINEPQSRRERKKAATRAQIVAAAIRLFSAHGIEAVTVDQIAAAADVGKGTIYNYFQTKEDIVVAFMVDLEHSVQKEAHRLGGRHTSVARLLTRFIQKQFRMKEKHWTFVRVVLGHMFLNTAQFLPYMAEMQKIVDPPLETLFRTLQQRGEIRSDLDLADLILTFKTIHLGLTALWAIEGPPFRQSSRVIEQEITLFCKGLEAR